MKRKALITATAVLLVAVMCLATASYAWFASGSAASVSTLNLSVTATDSGVEIATANMKDGYAAGSFGVQALKVSDFVTNGYVPNGISDTTAGALEPVSTDLLATNGDYDFFPSLFDPDTRQWTTQAETTSGYVLISFYARASAATTKNLNVSLANGTNFKNAAKVAVDVISATLDANDKLSNTSDLNGFDTAYTFSAEENPTETYKACNAQGAVSYRDASLSFEPVAGEDNEKRFTQVSDTKWETPIPVTFAENEYKLITVALWIEGMDDDCSGTWTDSSSLVISFS